MKNLIAFLVVALLTATLLAQSPQKMSYQAVIRDANNDLIKSQSVAMKISILKAGVAVYVETQKSVTNANGLVTIEIGNGTIVSGNFTTIDWANGIYSIKTETDPTGGTSYSISGTSQLLSVPYAFYAINAGSTNAIISKDTSVHFIGELYGGGVVFYVDPTGKHGLICSMLDVSSFGQAWSDVSATSIGTTAQSTWNGLGNCNAIIGQGGHTTSAAKLCFDYTNANYGTGVFSDWYLPSIDQLNMIYNVRYQVNKALETDGNSATTAFSIYYFSSTESTWTPTTKVDNFNFFSGQTGETVKTALDDHVRAVRNF
jgi:hypothetical protein